RKASAPCVLLTTHDMPETEHLADQICIMSEGQMSAFGTTLRLKEKYGGGNVLTVVARAATDTEHVLCSIVREAATLGLAVAFNADTPYGAAVQQATTVVHPLPPSTPEGESGGEGEDDPVCDTVVEGVDDDVRNVAQGAVPLNADEHEGVPTLTVLDVAGKSMSLLIS
ncbi:ABC transporter A, ABCA, partial [Kipferlia bialata]